MRNTISKRPIITLVSVIAAISVGVCLIMSSGIGLGKNSSEGGTTTGTHATWEGIPGGTTEENAIENASIVAEGKVISQRTEVRGPKNAEIVFTISTMEIPEVFSVSKSDVELVAGDMVRGALKIEILQTGGTSGNLVTLEPEETPLMEVGKTYFLMVKKAEEGYYLSVGGMYGTGEINNGKVRFVNDESQELFSDIEGEKISEITDILTDVVEENDIDSKVYVNKEGDAPADAIGKVDDNE